MKLSFECFDEIEKIHFHVGAHKTATTYIQDLLHYNGCGLSGNGVRYVPLWGKGEDRAAFRRHFYRVAWCGKVTRDSIDDLAAELRSIFVRSLQQTKRAGGPNTVLLTSYENILGSYNVALWRQGMYPRASLGFEVIRKAFHDKRVQIYIGVRSLDAFIESCYMQMVASRREKRSFRTIAQTLDFDRLSWTPVISSAGEQFGYDRVALWPYERFPAFRQRILDRLAGVEDGFRWKEKSGERNPSLTGRGVKVLRLMNTIPLISNTSKIRTRIKKACSSYSKRKRPNLMPQSVRDQLQSRYSEDLEVFASKFRVRDITRQENVG